MACRTIIPAAALLALSGVSSANAQTASAEPQAQSVPVAASDKSSPGLKAPSAEGLALPKLDYTPSPKLTPDFDKYFYFHRPSTTFAEAYADIRECHGLAGGKVAYRQGNSAFADTYTTSYLIPQYGMAGALGGALGGALVGLLIGGGNHDKIHRINIRNCMGFKGYQRYGLPKDLWEEFNLSPGKSRKNAEGSERAFRLQALVASGAQPKQEAIAQ